MFSAYPPFAVTLPLYIFSSKKKTTYLWIVFQHFFIKNPWKSRSRCPSTQKSTSGMLFLDFWSILEPLGGPRGAHVFAKIGKEGRVTSNQSRFFCDLLISGPFFGKSCVFDPLRASFWSPFWSFLVKIKAPFCWHFWLFFGWNFQQPNDPTTQQHGKPTHQHPNNPTTRQPNSTWPGGMREAIK